MRGRPKRALIPRSVSDILKPGPQTRARMDKALELWLSGYSQTMLGDALGCSNVRAMEMARLGALAVLLPNVEGV